MWMEWKMVVWHYFIVTLLHIVIYWEKLTSYEKFSRSLSLEVQTVCETYLEIEF